MKIYFKLETEHSFYRDPNSEIINTKEFNAIWKTIRDWDIGMTYLKDWNITNTGKIHLPKPVDPRKATLPPTEILYSGATGNNVRQILDALNPARKL